ncbi:MAG: beta-lactamase family protein [Rhodospirillales bacterium]|nr:MAG: beta-lactamase family protein [Rhodospirillales bacterium]
MTGDLKTRIARVAHAAYAQHRELCGVPAMAAGVVVDGELVAFSGFGARRHSLFRIASMTKSFTAAAALTLRDEGRLDLDRPIADYAPEFAGLRGPTSDSPAITTRHLLSMASGLATDDPWGDRHLDIADAALDAVVRAGPLFAATPGTVFEYSNLGYALIGRVMHRASGARPQELITERLLRPLGMTRTVWEAKDAPAGTDVIVGVRSDDGAPEPTPRDGGLAPMGGLWSTVADLAKWVDFLADAWPARDGADRGPLSRASRREMQRIGTAAEPFESRSADGTTWPFTGGYGLGLQIGHDAALGEVVEHSGGLPGYGSNMRWVKGTRLGLIALGNSTYAPMRLATRRALAALAAAGIARRPAITAPPALVQAGTALFALLIDWDAARARALFADNVAPDDKLARRQRRGGADHPSWRVEARACRGRVAHQRPHRRPLGDERDRHRLPARARGRRAKIRPARLAACGSDLSRHLRGLVAEGGLNAGAGGAARLVSFDRGVHGRVDPDARGQRQPPEQIRVGDRERAANQIVAVFEAVGDDFQPLGRGGPSRGPGRVVALGREHHVEDALVHLRAHEIQPFDDAVALVGPERRAQAALRLQVAQILQDARPLGQHAAIVAAQGGNRPLRVDVEQATAALDLLRRQGHAPERHRNAGLAADDVRRQRAGERRVEEFHDGVSMIGIYYVLFSTKLFSAGQELYSYRYRMRRRHGTAPILRFR